MNKLPFFFSIIFALIAATGNAMFAFGQKKTGSTSNPFIFLILALICCVVILVSASYFFPRENLRGYITNNYLWILISGIGFALTFIGFYFLYTSFGTSYYTIYAVLSIITTSIIVGSLIFKEGFNMYYLLSIISSFVTIILFTIGKASIK